MLSLVAKDAVNYEIAELLKISENTVKTHLVTYGESACAKAPSSLLCYKERSGQY